ncbi:DUF3861 domain-containing protein [Marinomonas pollencensis]|uniref:Uncharacterized protein DUF3861 n=1 Tax=Marinomonas pollencensis TaxID=491954 RepID=A0A3E0DJL2_9GAMM|nr:DUF3861 domain-containing protein [Marinomonas pollencensis]REG82899.1 uncharacterized protein DUF3861 [Marinomonas pollencensis]
MKGHLYKFTLEHLEDPKGNAITAEPVTFEARNHDDIFKILESMKGKMALSDSDAREMAIGIKLFGEVMLRNPENELFQQLRPHFMVFMKGLKKS